MKKEKFVLTFVFIFLMFFLSVNVISAQSFGFFDLDEIVERTGDAVKSIMGPILGNPSGGDTSEFLSAKIMVFFMIFGIVFVVLKKIQLFRGNKPVRVVVSIIFSILAVKFLREEELMAAILLPYGAFTTSLILFLPFIVWFFFVYSSGMSSISRITAWLLYGVFYSFMFIQRYDEINGSSGEMIFWIGLILVFAVAFLDNTIMRFVRSRQIKDIKDKGKRRALIDLLNQRQKALNVGDFKAVDDYDDMIDNL